MDKTQIINRLKSALVALSEQKTVMEVDELVFEFSGELEVGKDLKVIEGELTETLQLEDGRQLVIEDGKVKEIVEAEAEEQITELEADDDDDEAVEEDGIEHRLATMEGLVNALVEKNAVLEGVIEEMNGMKKDQEEMKSQLQELAKAPAVPATKKDSVGNNFNKTESRAAKIMSAQI